MEIHTTSLVAVCFRDTHIKGELGLKSRNAYRGSKLLGGEIGLYVRVSARQWDVAGVHSRNRQKSVCCRLSAHYGGIEESLVGT